MSAVRRGGFPRPGLWWRLRTGALAGAAILHAMAADHAALSGPMSVGFTHSCFQNVNRNDAEASFRVFLQTVGRKRGYDLQPVTRVYDDPREFGRAIERGALQIVIMDSWQFLTMNLRERAEPCFIASAGGRVGRNYLLLTRRDSRLDTIGDLKGTELVAATVATSNLGRYWLETLLKDRRLGPPESWFGQIETVPTATAAVLPVFFGRKPVCFVDQSGFDVMTELNPQVGKSLRIMAASESLPNIVICLGFSGWIGPNGRADCRESLEDLHQEPVGRQILTLFKIDRLVPFADPLLDPVRNLKARHEAGRPEDGR